MNVLLLGTPVAVIMAAVYSYLVIYVPLIGYVNILFLGGYVFATGYALARLVKFYKCRNQAVAFLLGCIIGTIGLYAAWVFAFKAMYGDEIDLAKLAFMPGFVWDAAVEQNKIGWWQGGPTGVFQWIICAIEATAIVLGCGIAALLGIDREVFCESCFKWCETGSLKKLKVTEEFSERFGSDDAQEWPHLEILQLPDADENEYPHFLGEVMDCPDCTQFSAIRLKLVSLEQGDEGPKENSTDIPGILLFEKGEEAS